MQLLSGEICRWMCRIHPYEEMHLALPQPILEYAFVTIACMLGLNLGRLRARAQTAVAAGINAAWRCWGGSSGASLELAEERLEGVVLAARC